MSKRQLIALFVCNLVIWTVGNGLIPLLPVYALQVGANPATSGYYLAVSYFALTLGALAAGWISDRFNQRRLPLLIAGLIGIPIAWLMGRAGNIWSLTLLTAVLWAIGGLSLALASILTGLSAGEHERGKIYGILSLSNGLGSLIGSLFIGYIAERWGYPAMLTAVALFFVLSPLASFFLEEKDSQPSIDEAGTAKQKLPLGRNFQLLFTASLVASISAFVIALGRSLKMDALDFGALAISATSAIGGLVAMPIPFLMGWLSDRSGRKLYLYLGYLAGMVSLFVLARSISLWNFSLVIVLQAIFFGINMSVGNALVIDIVPPQSLGRGLSLFSATSWIGGILGFAGAGYAMQNLGVSTTFIIAMCLPLIGIFLLIPIRSKVNGYRAGANSGISAT
jgi:MFS family permease